MIFFNTHDIARLAKVGAVCGFDMDGLLAEIGVSASACSGPDGSWDADTLDRLYRAGIKLSSKAHFPFVVGEYFLFDRVPEVDIFLTTSTTLKEALSIYHYLPYLLQPDTMAWMDEDDKHVYLSVELQQTGKRLENPGYIETVFVATLRLLRQVSGFADCGLLNLAFRHQPLQPASWYSREFGQEPEFGASYNRLTLGRHDLVTPLAGSSPALHAQARLLLEKRIRRHCLLGSLARAIETLVMQSPTITMPEVCTRLGLEPRSLQRRLKEEELSFSTVQARALFAMAQLLLDDLDMDIESIATKLGFADRHSFSRAFSKWAGVPPNQYRRLG